jgi:hemolysin activation/secretion protein
VVGIVGPHPFYFAPTLGDTTLRAYRFNQLAGDVAFSQTTDLRIDVFRIRSWLPGTIGVNLSLDHGRVFGPSASSVYHLDLGGGVWWSLLDAVGVSLSYYRGLLGGSRFVFALGPLFSRTGF